jgi:hypothetical protein
MGSAQLNRRIHQFIEAHAATPEQPAEYLRAFWCLKASFRLFDRHEAAIRDFIKGFAQ